MAQLQVSVAGAGQIGKRHIELIRAHHDSVLHSIVDPSPEAAALAKTLNVPWFAQLEAMLASKAAPQAIVLATPNHLHVPQALACISRGIACLIEKPLATTVHDAEQLCLATEHSRVPILVGHHRRHSGIMAASCAVLAAKRLGKLVAIQGAFMLYKAENEGYFEPQWRRSSGGGPILINMIHEVGNLRSLMGEIQAVHAFSSNATRGFDVEDTASINIRFCNGALGSFIVSDTTASSHSWEHTSGEDPRYAQAHADDVDCYVIAGTMGSLSVPTMRLKTFANGAAQSWHKPLQTELIAVPSVDPMQAQWQHFCEVLRGTAQPLVSARDGLQNLKIVDAIARSARTGQIIELL